jgi:hypothetical protein
MIYTTLELAQQAMMPADVVGLKPQQQAQYSFHEQQVALYGQYSQGILANGSHYGPNSPFAAEGIICANCVYYEQGLCELVQGNINPQGICKFWIIPENLLGA